MKYETNSNSAKIKAEFRKTDIWKNFRFMMQIKHKVDDLTHTKLRKGWNLHHQDMRIENYTNLDENKFNCLNSASHDTIHFLFTYYKKDPEILDRLKDILDRMIEYNQ